MSKKQQRVFWLFLVAFVITAGAALPRQSIPFSSATSDEPIKRVNDESTLRETAQQPQATDIQAELITITPRGFEPAEFRTRKGRFLLVVDNRSGTPDIDLRLDREAGNRMHEIRVPKELSSWSEVINLSPGHYVLSETTHSEWACRISVTAQ